MSRSRWHWLLRAADMLLELAELHMCCPAEQLLRERRGGHRLKHRPSLWLDRNGHAEVGLSDLVRNVVPRNFVPYFFRSEGHPQKDASGLVINLTGALGQEGDAIQSLVAYASGAREWAEANARRALENKAFQKCFAGKRVYVLRIGFNRMFDSGGETYSLLRVYNRNVSYIGPLMFLGPRTIAQTIAPKINHQFELH